MKGIDILTAFELEINKLDDTLQKPLTDDSIYWINQAVVKFVKDRFNGNAPKRTSYEQNEKRTRDLIGLLCEKVMVDIGYDKKEVTVDNIEEYVPERLVFNPGSTQFENKDENNYVQWYETYQNGSKEFVRYIDVYGDKAPVITTPKTIIQIVDKVKKNPSYDEYECFYPEDLMFVLNEDVVISDNDGDHEMDTCVFECTADSFMYRINNKLTDFHYRFHRARPLRIRTKDGVRLLTDKKYKIKEYTLGYLKVPEEITSEDPFKEYKDFEDYTWLEIIKIAAQMYVENQSDPRYKTITQEVLTQE